MTVSNELQKKVMEIMKDGEARDIPKIKADLERKKNFIYGRDYREGHLAGVLRVLASNGRLEKVERGVYRLNRADGLTLAEVQRRENAGDGGEAAACGDPASLEQIWQETIVSLEAQYRSLLSRMDAIAMSSLTPADLESLGRLSKLKEELRKILVRHGRGNG